MKTKTELIQLPSEGGVDERRPSTFHLLELGSSCRKIFDALIQDPPSNPVFFKRPPKEKIQPGNIHFSKALIVAERVERKG